MFRPVVLLVALAACGTDPVDCGDLSLDLTEDAANYPMAIKVGCDVDTGGVWDKQRNEATFAFTDPELPADVKITATMPLMQLHTGVKFTVPVGVAGEAATGAKNHANLTSGSLEVLQEFGTDPKKHAYVFKIRYDLEWLGTGNYHATGEARVWFIAPGTGPL